MMYWCCERCAHVWGDPAPDNCEHCRSNEITGFDTLDEAEECSQEILDERAV